MVAFSVIFPLFLFSFCTRKLNWEPYDMIRKYAGDACGARWNRRRARRATIHTTYYASALLCRCVVVSGEKLPSDWALAHTVRARCFSSWGGGVVGRAHVLESETELLLLLLCWKSSVLGSFTLSECTWTGLFRGVALSSRESATHRAHLVPSRRRWRESSRTDESYHTMEQEFSVGGVVPEYGEGALAASIDRCLIQQLSLSIFSDQHPLRISWPRKLPWYAHLRSSIKTAVPEYL